MRQMDVGLSQWRKVCLDKSRFTVLQFLRSQPENTAENDGIYKVPSSSLWGGASGFSQRDIIQPGADINVPPGLFVFLNKGGESGGKEEECTTVDLTSGSKEEKYTTVDLASGSKEEEECTTVDLASGSKEEEECTTVDLASGSKEEEECTTVDLASGSKEEEECTTVDLASGSKEEEECTTVDLASGSKEEEECTIVDVTKDKDCLIVELDSTSVPKNKASTSTSSTPLRALTSNKGMRDSDHVTARGYHLTPSPVLIRSSSVESLHETQALSRNSNSNLLNKSAGSPLPKVWSICHPLPLKSPRHLATAPLPLGNSFVRTPHYIPSVVVSRRGPPVEIDLTQDEGIVIDDSSCDDVTVVEAVEKGRGVVRECAPRVTTNQIPLVDCCGIMLYQADLNTLRPLQWLNDQVINAYMKLLMKSFNSSPGNIKRSKFKVHITSTFFYTKLRSSGYEGVQRWLKNVKMRSLRLLLVPIHLGSHWTIAVVDLRMKSIAYYDSMGARNVSCLKRLKLFLVRCGMEGKLGTSRHWRLYYPQDIPLQNNCSDCGVFVCQYARWLCSTRLKRLPESRSKIPFTQKHMPHFRSMMVEELTAGRLSHTLYL